MFGKAELVRMTRDADSGGPATAEVHPDEVANYRAGGWTITPEAPEAPPGDSSKKKASKKASTPEAPEANGN